MNFRRADKQELEKLRELGIKSWTPFKQNLTDDNWKNLYKTIIDPKSYANLLKKAECVVCEDEDKKIIGMAFLVPNGNPTEIYDANWCHLRFVSVDPNYRGKGIGKRLTKLCIEIAIKNNEQTMALHTSEIMHSAQHIYEKIGFKMLREIEPRHGIRYWLYTLQLNKISV